MWDEFFDSFSGNLISEFTVSRSGNYDFVLLCVSLANLCETALNLPK